MKRGQISFEYLILMGFVTLILSIILGVAFFYVDGVKDQTNIGHVDSFAKKVISTSEIIFYAGEPSQSTIEAYLPGNIEQIDIAENTLFVSLRTSSGLNKIGFPSNVNITGNITSTEGIKIIEMVASNGQVIIRMA
jgi:uncharacterized protein (UPF0333 family)